MHGTVRSYFSAELDENIMVKIEQGCPLFVTTMLFFSGFGWERYREIGSVAAVTGHGVPLEQYPVTVCEVVTISSLMTTTGSSHRRMI